MPNGIEIERKYIIHIPDIDSISAFAGYTKSAITQTYLESPEGTTRRVRKREFANHTVYTETIKKRIDKISSREDESEITEEKYTSMLLEIKPGTSHLHKTRHTIEYMGHVIEIDVYPQWKKFCIMETELENKDESVNLPDIIKILSEVTGEKRYSNASMAESFPPEPVSD